MMLRVVIEVEPREKEIFERAHGERARHDRRAGIVVMLDDGAKLAERDRYRQQRNDPQQQIESNVDEREEADQDGLCDHERHQIEVRAAMLATAIVVL